MAKIPEGHVVHLTPARLRVRVPDKHRDQSFFELTREQLSLWPMIERVEVNPATASVLIHAADTEAVLMTLEAGGPFVIVGRESEREVGGLAQKRGQLTKVDEQLQRLTRGRVTAARVSVLLGVGASVAFQLARGRRLSAAVTLLLYTSGTLQRWWLSAGRADRDHEPALEESEVNRRRLTGPILG